MCMRAAGNWKMKTLVDAFMLISLLLVFLLIRDQNCVFLIGLSFWALKWIIIIVKHFWEGGSDKFHLKMHQLDVAAEGLLVFLFIRRFFCPTFSGL